MNFHRLDLNLLVALDALLLERSITQAGRRIHLTQSAMSGALARLREFFGDELLVQVGRKMVPTPLAESLTQPIREILLKVQSTIETRPGFDPASSQRLFTLMMSDYVSMVVMNEVVRHVESVAPHVRFELISNNVDAPIEVLDRADVDILIMPQNFISESHPRETLFDDEYCCVVWKDNPLVGDTLTLDQYFELGHVVVKFGVSRAPTIDERVISALERNRRVEVIAMSFSAVPVYVVGTRRIATIHRRLAEAYTKYLPLKVLQPPIEFPHVTQAMQWHKYFDQDPGTVWLRGVLKEVAGRRALQT